MCSYCSFLFAQMCVLEAFSWMLEQGFRADTDHGFNLIRIAKLNEMLRCKT